MKFLSTFTRVYCSSKRTPPAAAAPAVDSDKERALAEKEAEV